MKIVKAIAWVFASLVLFVFITNIWVLLSTQSKIYALADAEYNDVALVLGTSKRTRSGGENRFFKERMTTAAALHNQGTVKHILVSGDNGSKYYNEPIDMLNALGDFCLLYTSDAADD